MTHRVARKIRVQHPGALYHVINRGNYQSAVFQSAGATRAFERTLAQACERAGWRVHAYVIMRNHFHLALETPQPNLASGMQWLLGTFAARFNRLRAKRGHLFQGRYHALLVEDAAALFRVANYIHLNPVRARIVPAERIASYPWSSLHRWATRRPTPWLTPDGILSALDLHHRPKPWGLYADYLSILAADPVEQERQGFAGMSRGWAIGTTGWQRTLAREFASLALSPGLEAAEARVINEGRWWEALEQALARTQKSSHDIVHDAKGARWKIELATHLRQAVNAPYRWIAAQLHMGSPLAVRVNVWRQSNG